MPVEASSMFGVPAVGLASPPVLLPARFPAGPLNVMFVGSYPPRECGIATFTRDTRQAIRQIDRGGAAGVIALNDPGATYAYPPEVAWQIDRDLASSYDEAAEFVNRSGCQVVNVQHEYGLFGGDWGDFLFRFLERVRRPVVLTMHTVLPAPDATLRDVTRDLIAHAERVVVLARTAMDILWRDYAVSSEKLRFVPHGVPHVQLTSEVGAKRALNLEGRTVLTTCGLMGPGKGIEYAIDAVAQLAREFPAVLYVVAGETHPGEKAQNGERYRERLVKQVRQLGMDEHVHFENRYLSNRELVLHLLASDVYVVPYLNLNQIVSGTIAYALGCGRAIVSTASLYAREVLSQDRGVLIKPRQPESIGAGVASILRNPEGKLAMQRRAYALGHSMIWPNVARAYIDTFKSAISSNPGNVVSHQEVKALPPFVQTPATAA